MLGRIMALYVQRFPVFLELMGQHIVITLICVLIITVAGLGLGIVMTKHVFLAAIVLRLTSFLYTIPSIALFGILVSISGIGLKSAVIAIVLYGLLPMVRNTYTGLKEVSPDVLEAAVGMGTTAGNFCGTSGCRWRFPSFSAASAPWWS